MHTSDREMPGCFWAPPCHPISQRRLQCLCWSRTLLSQSCIHVVSVAFAGSTTAHLPCISFLPQTLPSTHPMKNESHFFFSLNCSISHMRLIRAGLRSALMAATSTRLLLLGQSSCSSSIPPGIAGNRINIYPVRKGADNVFHKVRNWKKVKVNSFHHVLQEYF